MEAPPARRELIADTLYARYVEEYKQARAIAADGKHDVLRRLARRADTSPGIESQVLRIAIGDGARGAPVRTKAFFLRALGGGA